MYCHNCGTKIPKNSKYCPSCGAPVIYDKKSNPIIDAIVLGGIIVLFIFSIIKISDMITFPNSVPKIQSKNSIKAKGKKNLKTKRMPEVRAPSVRTYYNTKTDSPEFTFREKIQAILIGIPNNFDIYYSSKLKGYSVEITVFYNKNKDINFYLNKFASIFAVCYGESQLNIKFVVCNIKKKKDTKLSIAVGYKAAEKIPSYTWKMFNRNGEALINWILNNQTKPGIAKPYVCIYLNSFNN